MKFKNPSLAARRAAEMFVDFETTDGVSEKVADLIADSASEADARDEIAAFIDEKTGLPELLAVAEEYAMTLTLARQVLIAQNDVESLRQMDANLARARAAIAKAKGETP